MTNDSQFSLIIIDILDMYWHVRQGDAHVYTPKLKIEEEVADDNVGPGQFLRDSRTKGQLVSITNDLQNMFNGAWEVS